MKLNTALAIAGEWTTTNVSSVVSTRKTTSFNNPAPMSGRALTMQANSK